MLNGTSAAAVATESAAPQPRARTSIADARAPHELADRLSSILRGLFQEVHFELLVRDERGELSPVGARGRSRLLPTLRARLLTSRHDFTEPYLFPTLRGQASLMSAPLVAAGDLVGLVIVETAPGSRDFRGADLDALEGVASLLSLALHRFRAERKARSRRDLDLETACRVQRRLMSGTLPPDVGVDAHVEYHPALGVGGDFYSLRDLGGGRVSVAIGDVSGNGISAALVMSRVAHDIERGLSAGEAPASVLGRMNADLLDVESEMFVTASCIRLDVAARRLTLANAGHLPLVVRRASGETFAWGGASGVPLGMAPCEYLDEDLELEARDILILMTDGLVEGLHPQHGLERLLEVVRGAPHDPRAVSQRIRTAVDAAAQGQELDDVTWVGLQLA